MKPKMSLKIKEEVKKQFDAGFLVVAQYLEWVANIVPVPKKDGKVTFLYRTSMSLWITQPISLCFPSWTGSRVTIR